VQKHRGLVVLHPAPAEEEDRLIETSDLASLRLAHESYLSMLTAVLAT
jgi:hypothetical protein